MVRLVVRFALTSVIGVCSSLGLSIARADDVAIGSVRLRGGFDANPTLLPAGKSSVFGGIEGAFAAGREAGDNKGGVVGEFSRIQYATPLLAPMEHERLGIEGENTGFSEWSLRSSTSAEINQAATLRSFDAVERVRAQWTGGVVHPFIVGEVRYASLNETNAILSTFLPESQKYGRGTITPGISIKLGGLEFGTSVALSSTRYLDRTDLFGLRRDNERIEPFVFGRYEGQGLTLNTSVSRLAGHWHDAAFSPVKQTLYDLSLSKTMGAWTLDAGASRYAGETTFPISPLTISSTRSAKLTYAPDDQWSYGVLLRSLHTAYLDSPYMSDTLGYGLTMSYAPAKDWIIGAELLRIKAVALNGVPVDGGIVSVSVTRKFAGETKLSAPTQKQWAADEPPIARPNPLLGSNAIRLP